MIDQKKDLLFSILKSKNACTYYGGQKRIKDKGVRSFKSLWVYKVSEGKLTYCLVL